VEAFLSGVPVVGSSSGSIPELIGNDGFVFPEGNVGALVDTLRQVLHDPARTAACAERARARALRAYTWQAVAAQRYRLYTDMLSTVTPSRDRLQPREHTLAPVATDDWPPEMATGSWPPDRCRPIPRRRRGR
jgi:hypothetical protein